MGKHAAEPKGEVLDTLPPYVNEDQPGPFEKEMSRLKDTLHRGDVFEDREPRMPHEPKHKWLVMGFAPPLGKPDADLISTQTTVMAEDAIRAVVNACQDIPGLEVTELRRA